MTRPASRYPMEVSNLVKLMMGEKTFIVALNDLEVSRPITVWHRDEEASNNFLS